MKKRNTHISILMHKIAMLFLLFFLFALHQAFADNRIPVIIDTDGGADDLRAISLILSCSEFEIKAITTSDGVLSPEDALEKVTSLLCKLNHEGIPTAAGRANVSDPCLCRKINENIVWGNLCELNHINFGPSSELINRTLSETREPILFFAMSSLTSLHDALLLNSENRTKISKVIWYSGSPVLSGGFNYESDTAAAKSIVRQGIPLATVHNRKKSPITFNSYFLNLFKQSDNRAGKNVFEALSSSDVLPIVKSGHFKLWDDLLPIYYVFPELFSEKKSELSITEVELLSNVTEKKIGVCIEKLLNPEAEDNIVFHTFPESSRIFAADFSIYSDSILKKHGRREFRAGVLTNELHGHLGIYATIGVKMGIRALDYFHCDIDELEVRSYTGNRPPLSCLNDGIQVSTGASLGHGLITVVNSGYSEPTAEFFHDNFGINISLKKEIAEEIQHNFNTIIATYGLFTEAYWQQVRVLAIKYWLEFDRNEIFDIHIITKP